MDQEVIYDVGKFDRSQVDLSKTATSVQEFMQQMIVGREQCEEIATASIQDIPEIKPATVYLIPTDRSVNCECKWKPDKEWSQRANETKKWCYICLENRLDNFPINEPMKNKFAHHKGTPPTVQFVKSLSDNKVNNLIYFLENGYSLPLMEWIYALMAVIKKPLLHDVCSSLRDMARRCRVLRADLLEQDYDKICEYTQMIALVGIYFGQKDLADV